MVFPDTICFTGNSTFFKFTVVCKTCGISKAELSGNARRQAHRDFLRLEHKFGHVSRACRFPNRLLDFPHKLRRELMAWLHEQEQHDSLILVLWSPLTHTNTISDPIRKLGLNDAVYLGRSESHATWVQHTVRPAQEHN